MNIKLKFNLLRYWSGKINKNQGFAMPIAMGLGFAITLVGLSMLIKTQSDQAKAYSQKQKSESLSAAEIGVTQIQNLINDNKVLMMYPSHCVTGNTNCWTNVKTTIADNTNAPVFQDELEKTTPTSTQCSNITRTRQQIEQDLNKIRELTIASQDDVSTWERVNISSNSEIEYYYRLVGYEYGNIGKYPGTGVLIVEGLAKHPSATNDSNDPSGSRTLIRVTVNITDPGQPEALKRPTAPGLWLTSGATNDSSHGISSNGTYQVGSTYQSDVLLSDCNMALPNYPRVVNVNGQSVSGIEWQLNNGVVRDDPGPNASPTFTSDDIDYKGAILKLTQPPAPTKPDTFPSVMQLGDIGSSDLTLPRTGDIITRRTITRTDAQGNSTKEPIKVYEYLVSNINTNGNKTITITHGERVTFYVNGNIEGGGNGGIKHDCTGSASCKPTDFQIFGYSTSATASICFKGDTTLEAFVLAPGYDVGVTGNANFKGSIWAKSWGKLYNCSSNNGKLALTQTASWSELPSTYKTADILPQLGRVTDWQQIEGAP